LVESVKQYARDRLMETGAGEKFRTRHLHYFLEFAVTNGNSTDAAPLDRLESEHDNLRAALAWRLADELRADTSLRLAGALRHFWEVRGFLSEGRAHLRAALSHDETAGPTVERALALNGAGYLA